MVMWYSVGEMFINFRSVTHFDVISRSHADTSVSHALALFKVTLLFLSFIFENCLFECLHRRPKCPCFKKLMHFQRLEKCKFQNVFWVTCPRPPRPDSTKVSPSLENLRALEVYIRKTCGNFRKPLEN